MRKYLKRHGSQGFSLIELMVAMVLGLVMIAAIANMFTGSSQSYRQDEAATRMQDELRYALSQIARDFEMAGYWAEVFDPGTVTVTSGLPIGTDCGASGVPWAYANLARPIEFGDNLTASTAASTFSCISSSSFKAGTDVLALRRVAGEITADTGDSTLPITNLQPGQIYLRSQNLGVAGALVQINSSGVDPSPPSGRLQYYEYQPSVYYIRNYAAVAGDGIPSLCREYLAVVSGTPTMRSECFATGIENLQVEFGVDTDITNTALTADQRTELIPTPNIYVAAPTPAQLANTVALRISLLARSESSDRNYSNQKTYTLGNVSPITPNDNYYRRVASAVVVLRNPASQLIFSTL